MERRELPMMMAEPDMSARKTEIRSQTPVNLAQWDREAQS